MRPLSHKREISVNFPTRKFSNTRCCNIFSILCWNIFCPLITALPHLWTGGIHNPEKKNPAEKNYPDPAIFNPSNPKIIIINSTFILLRGGIIWGGGKKRAGFELYRWDYDGGIVEIGGIKMAGSGKFFFRRKVFSGLFNALPLTFLSDSLPVLLASFCCLHILSLIFLLQQQHRILAKAL